MKTPIWAFIALVCVLMGSCTQSDEIVYSCDSEINTWVKENLSSFRDMNRTDWSTIGDMAKEKAAYRAFSLETRQAFWLDKIDEVMTLPWNEKELIHLKELKDFIADNLPMFAGLSRLSVEDRDRVQAFIYLWCEKAQEEMGWKPSTLFAICGDGHRMEDKDGRILISSVSGTLANSCDCSLRSDFCNQRMDVIISTDPTLPTIPIGWAKCVDSDCKPTSGSCGLLFLYDCTGQCEYHYYF